MKSNRSMIYRSFAKRENDTRAFKEAIGERFVVVKTEYKESNQYTSDLHGLIHSNPRPITTTGRQTQENFLHQTAKFVEDSNHNSFLGWKMQSSFAQEISDCLSKSCSINSQLNTVCKCNTERNCRCPNTGRRSGHTGPN